MDWQNVPQECGVLEYRGLPMSNKINDPAKAGGKRFVLIDLEATCWEKNPPAPHEVIEISSVRHEVGRGPIAEVVFQIDKRAGTEHKVHVRLLARAPGVGHPVDWDKAMAVAFEPAPRPEPRALWAAVPESLDTDRKLKALEKAFNEHLYSTQKISLFENRELEMVSLPGETEAAFKNRCKQAAEQQRKQAQELESVKFKPKIEAAEQSTSKGREDRIAKLKADLQAKQDELAEKYRLLAEEVTPLQVKPRKVDIRVTHFGLAWAPFWKQSGPR
jgi:hypothetical protein